MSSRNGGHFYFLETHPLHLGSEDLLIAELIDILNYRSVAREDIINSTLAYNILNLAAAEWILASKTRIFLLGVALEH